MYFKMVDFFNFLNNMFFVLNQIYVLNMMM